MSYLHVATRFCNRVWRCFHDASGVQHSATIAYFGLISIVPFVILSAAILAVFLEKLPEASDGKHVVDQVLDQFSTALPFLAGQVRALIRSLAETKTSIGVITGTLLLFGSQAVFSAMERGINAVLQSHGHRHYLMSKLVLASLIISAGGLLFAWQLVTSLSQFFFDEAGISLPSWLFTTILWQWIVSIMIPGVGFYLIVKFMAQRRFERTDRWIGAAVFAILFNAAHYGLQIYLEKVVFFQQLYGTAGAFLGLIIWLYIAAIVLLASCAVIRVLSDMRITEAE